jgi:hypothetical protein
VRGGGAFNHLIQEAIMLCGGLNPLSIRLRQVDDKAVVSRFETERVSTRRPFGADRGADFGDRPDFPTLAENVTCDRDVRAHTMEDEIVLDALVAQP